MFDENLNFDTQGADVHNYKCPSCGAQMEFLPEKQALVCPHCETAAEIELCSNVTERDFSELYKQNWSGHEVKTVKCENCGSEEILVKKEMSTRCPFCGSNTVLKESELNSVRPDTVMPFKFSKETAVQKCVKWLKSKLFAPKQFKQNVTIDTVAGTYNPVWTFDSSTRTSYKGVLGKRVTRTVTVNGKTVTKTEIKWFTVNDTVDCMFDDIYVAGSDRISENVMNKLKPFDKSAYTKYSDGLLAGFAATNYTVQPMDAWKKAEQKMYAHIRQLIMRKHNADTVKSLNMSVNHLQKSFKYLLLPVYVAATRYKNQLYSLYVNGVHGKITGKAPVSKGKVAIAALLGLLVVGGLLIGAMLLRSMF